jgi:DNA-binding transcriptional MerR regulator
MNRSSEPLWGLDELCAQAALALAVDYEGQDSGRVRDLPDARTVRFYATLGLVDRPTLHGRKALYGWRHLLQVVAIKRLQARGLALAEVQARLVGQTDAALAEVARMPAERPPEGAPVPAAQAEGKERGAFWKDRPAATPAGALVGVPLADGITLLIRAARPLDEHDLEALRVAAAPLLKLAEARHLIEDKGDGT